MRLLADAAVRGARRAIAALGGLGDERLAPEPGLALGLDPEAALAISIDNCSITRIDRIDGPGLGHGWRVMTVNRPPR